MPIAVEGWCTKTNQDEQLGAVEKLSLLLASNSGSLGAVFQGASRCLVRTCCPHAQEAVQRGCFRAEPSSRTEMKSSGGRST